MHACAAGGNHPQTQKSAAGLSMVYRCMHVAADTPQPPDKSAARLFCSGTGTLAKVSGLPGFILTCGRGRGQVGAGGTSTSMTGHVMAQHSIAQHGMA